MKGMKGRLWKKLKYIPTLSIKQGLVLHFSPSDKNLSDPSLSNPLSGLEDDLRAGIKLHTSQKHSRSCSIASDESVTSMCSFQSLAETIESPAPSPGENERNDQERAHPSKSEMVKCPPGGENSVILYTTSLRGIRKPFEDCTAIRFLLKSFKIKFYERDVSMDLELRSELWKVMGARAVPPQLFVKGQFIGGADEVVGLHEQGKLHKLLQGIPADHQLDQPCQNCCNVGFVLCSICNGSCKVPCEDENEEQQLFTRCCHCNENGLVSIIMQSNIMFHRRLT
uniref:Glutaredoxin domain-containing protein n=1 Tax=Kalanchoe fedtschenkoi TaxID=63787 RepID=A0A7N0UPC8_KALFE